MGSKLSASSGAPSEPVAPLPPLTAAPPPPLVSGDTPTTTESLENPGEYEELGKKVKDQLFPSCFDGAKFVIQKGLSSNFQTMHSLVLGSSSQAPCWQYGATYVGTTKVGENEGRPVMVGDMSTSGNFTALLVHQLGQWKMKLNAQTQKSQWIGYQGSVDYIGQDFTASATLANPDVFSGSGVFVAQYLQALTKRLALGSELVYQRSGGMQGSMISVGGFYKADMWTFSGRFGLHSWNLNYHQKLDSHFTLLTSLDGSLMQNETIAGVGYVLNVGGVTMKGKVSSHGTVSATLEKGLDPLPGSLVLSGQLNHWTDDSKFGIAVVLG